MEITPYGFEAFRVQGRDIDLLVNPINGPKVGYKVPSVNADLIVLTSEKDYTDKSRARGDIMAIDRPGEYEFHGAFLRGFRTGKTVTSYVIELDDLRVIYLGEISALLGDEVLEEITDSDILFIPVGGGDLISPKQAAELVSQVSPRIVIPTHFRTPELELPGFESPAKFLNELGKNPTPEERLKVTRRDLPEELEVALLQP